MTSFNETTNIFVFGDSLSDAGNSFALTFKAIPPEPPYFSGRFSNGLVAVEYLAEDLGLTLNLYYDDEVGNNFAVGAAQTGSGNSNNDNIASFLPGVTLPGLTQQVEAFEHSLGNSDADADALYIVWAGPNNFLDYLGGSVPNDPAVLLESGIDNKVDNINRLIGSGAANLVVPNMPSLGRLPFSIEFQDEATAISIAYNGGLSLALDNLVLENSSAQITQVDLFSANEAIAGDPLAFGLNNITDPLLLSGLDPTQTTGFFFWDIFHPTTEAHALFSNTISQTINGEIPQPTFNDLVGTGDRDFIFASQNSDNIDGFAGDDLILGRDGDDRLEGWGGNDPIFGGRGNDIIDGGSDRDLIQGGLGDDLLFGSAGNDYVRGDGGKDILIGGDDRDYLGGGDGDDYLLGGNGVDYLRGNSGNDILNGGGEDDSICGDAGDDLIDGGAGNDVLFGHTGADTFKLTANFGTDLISDFQLGSDRLMLAGEVTLDDLYFNGERIFLTATDETLAILSEVNTTNLSQSDFI